MIRAFATFKGETVEVHSTEYTDTETDTAIVVLTAPGGDPDGTDRTITPSAHITDLRLAP